jgi:hypothetical protein
VGNPAEHPAATSGYGSSDLRAIKGADAADGRIVLLTAFRKTRRHDQRQIDRAIRAQKVCERDHRRPTAEAYERQV